MKRPLRFQLQTGNYTYRQIYILAKHMHILLQGEGNLQKYKWWQEIYVHKTHRHLNVLIFFFILARLKIYMYFGAFPGTI